MREWLEIVVMLGLYVVFGLGALMAYSIMETEEHKDKKWPRAIFWICIIVLCVLTF